MVLRGGRKEDIIVSMKKDAELWEKTLAILREKLSENEYRTWIEFPLTLRRWNRGAGILHLEVPHDLHKTKILLKYSDVLEEAASEALGEPVSIRIMLPGEGENIKSPVIRDEDGGITFNPRYSFDNFIITDNNEFAAKAAQAVAKSPGKANSPLFIYGGNGLGKTHLLHAIGIYILEELPDLSIIYVTSEEFADDVVNAAFQSKKTNAFKAFKEKYRSVDVLLIDDIQFISEKEKTIEEVFHTYTTLYTLGKQMVFASDRPPKDILGLDERLYSRLSEGLLANIQAPSYEEKIAILKDKARLAGVADERDGLLEVITFIADSVRTNNVRELEGALNTVLTMGEFMVKPLTKALARQALTGIARLGGTGVSAKDIKKVVAAHYGITVADIDSADRRQTIARPRHIAYYLCRELTDMSFPKIAEAFARDYKTVHHGYTKTKNDLEKDEQLRKDIAQMTEIIQEDY